nr:endonuclease MutS2 [candidate division Zixibacteria bacterium]
MIHGFDRHTLDVLEYFKILSILKGLCLTPYGIDLIDRTGPSVDPESICVRLDEVTQMKDIVQFGDAFPLARLEDVTKLIVQSRTQGMRLDPKDILKIRELIDISAELHDYARSERQNFPRITEYLTELHPFPEIKSEIVKTIDFNGEILDGASQKLKQLRRDIGETRRNLIHRLEHILQEKAKSPGWQDDTVMQRDGRYVIPVIAGQFHHNSGIIHDRSQSGATLFVEPNEVVESNNRLVHLMQDERLEIDRILKHITTLIGEGSYRLLANCELIGILDYIHAAAAFSIKTDGRQPRLITGGKLHLMRARHPLLWYYAGNKKEIVANDFFLDDSRQALIITGPNTGGKTVALKTVGLLVLLAQSGLHIPAGVDSEIGIFKSVFADIGDEQSIELSLSTFSSHIRQIIYAVSHAGSESLVLLDEIGAGTDPKEGAALAEAIILKLIGRGAKLIVTTHYSQLKTLPMIQPEIENASYEFDRASLRPTFRLQVGIPGGSYAVEIARRLGLPEDIAGRAAQLLGKGERSLTTLIESLEKELSILRHDKTALEQKLTSASRLEEQYNTRINNLEVEIDEIKKRHLGELESTLYESRTEIERLVKQIRESKASSESVKQTHKFLKDRAAKIDHLKHKYIPRKSRPDQLEPGDMVLIDSLRREGEFVGLAGDDRAKVRIGNIMSTVPVTELKKITDYKKDSGATGGSVGARDLSAPGPEIHLMGMTVEEAKETLDKFLDSAVLTGLTQIYVVHGKGTGALRKNLGAFLKQHPAVKEFRLGDWNEGGAGVTIVKLK